RAGLALDGLHDDGGDALAGLVRLVELVLHGLGVAELDEVDAGQQRQERLPVLPAPQERERAAALAVEAPGRADEVGLAREDAGELDGALYRVGPVVDEERVLEVARRDLAQQLGERAAQWVQELLARERHARELIGDRLDDLGMADARAVDAV